MMTNRTKPNMDVIGADGVHVGTVSRLIVLNRMDVDGAGNGSVGQ